MGESIISELQKMKIMILWAKIKDKFLIKVPVHSYSPAPCPECGYLIEVPLTRTAVPISCVHCKSTSYTLAVGILDRDKDRLQHVYSEVIDSIQRSSITYNQGRAKHTIN